MPTNPTPKTVLTLVLSLLDRESRYLRAAPGNEAAQQLAQLTAARAVLVRLSKRVGRVEMDTNAVTQWVEAEAEARRMTMEERLAWVVRALRAKGNATKPTPQAALALALFLLDRESRYLRAAPGNEAAQQLAQLTAARAVLVRL
ncbi:MAG: hypothetical protein GY731_14705, partial [Gammaproteobacteria bacterium]|nr:hypothetical protein [Gammaproteobacteria bacterium]